ncbi:ABC transporter ATP-binding protein [Brevibacillus brevis]|uniref:ABC transporter ATP-binding protein n=1 Tax=Brevibacillus brevis TaxID=1393 RepID=A0ABY9T927_BREBE|nr:ABC transporter ATP-binding protein [Brevibacillus brevis]WNC16605.1 ABC transporter ATP-binding protein [Brevibacillus brevis]
MSEEQRRTPPGPPGAGPGGQRPMGFGGGPGMLTMPGQKAKNFKGTLRRLLGYLKPYRVKLSVVFLTAALSTLFSILSPKLLGNATTTIFEGFMGKLKGVPGATFDFSAVWQIVLTLIGLYLFSSLFAYVQQYLMAGVAQKIVYTLRKEVNEKLARLPLRYFDGRTHGEVMSRVVNDVDTISGTLQQSLTQMITSVITLIGVIVMMLTISPLMTLIVLVTIPLSFVVIKQVALRSMPHFKGQQQALGALNGHVEEMYTGHKIVKAFGREQSAIEKFDSINEKLYESGWKAQFIAGVMMPLMMLVGNIGFVLVSVVGGILVTRGSISIGDVQAFIQYAQQFSQPITQTANIANIIQSTLVSAERIFEILDEREEAEEAVSQTASTGYQGHVRFENVSFGYKEGEPLIQHMNIDVTPGMTVAIVGPTGAGKTTLVNLLMRFYEIGEGRITIDGRDIRSMPRSELRSQFGMVLQDTWLFNGTVLENIAYGRAGASEEEIIQAARAAHADHFVRTLPDGYETVLNEEASNISQGQKQLLTIARAFLADPAILILDEATSSVDTRTELLIQKAMSGLMQGRTSFVIAHRLSTIRDADLILVMNHGTVIEQGNHEELLAKGGFYADLYNSQFSQGSATQQVS